MPGIASCEAVTVALAWALITATVAAMDWQSMTVDPPGAKCSFFVQSAGVQRLDSLFLQAIRKAFEEAARQWPSKRRLNAKVRFMYTGNVLARHKPHFVRVAHGVDVQSAALSQLGLDSFLEKHNVKEDIRIELNANAKWYAGTTRPAADAYDVTTVVLREIYHNVMFSGHFNATSSGSRGWLRNNIASRFDMMVMHSYKCALTQVTSEKEIGRALTSGSLNFFIVGTDGTGDSRQRLKAPSTFSSQSVYTMQNVKLSESTELWTRTGNMLKGVVSRTVPNLVLEMQASFLNKTVKSAPICREGALARNAKDEQHSIDQVISPGKKNRVTSVGGIPMWVFGLVVVATMIFLVAAMLCICTTGAKGKQREGASCWKSNIFASCCTGVEPNTPRALYNAAAHVVNRISRASFERRSIDRCIRSPHMCPVPTHPQPVFHPTAPPNPYPHYQLPNQPLQSSLSSSSPPPLSETVLPGRLQTNIPFS